MIYLVAAGVVVLLWIVGSYVAGRSNDHELTMARHAKQRNTNGVKRCD